MKHRPIVRSPFGKGGSFCRQKAARRLGGGLLAAALCLWGQGGLTVAAEGTPPDLGVARVCLQTGLAEAAEVIDISSLSFAPADLTRVYGGILQDDPSLFYVAPRLSYTVQGEVVAAVYPAYTMTGEELAAAKADYRRLLSDLLTQMEAALGASPRCEAEIALYVHEILASRYAYDTRALTGESGYTDAYSLFSKGVGVCQAYAMAAMALLREAGLEADLVTSRAMDHAWIHVRVAGEWYHMDVTRDDPVTILPDGSAVAAGVVSHERVLRSDAGMAALGYHDYTCAGGHTCGDGRYEATEALAACREAVFPLTSETGVWVGFSGGGAPITLLVREEGFVPLSHGDLNADGALTPADLLDTMGEVSFEDARAWLRQALVGAITISPDTKTSIDPSTSQSRE